jgi:hypothetical protein
MRNSTRQTRTGSEGDEQDHIDEEQDNMISQVDKQSDKAGHRVGRVLSFSPVVGIGPPPFGSGGRGTLAGEREGGRVPIPTRGHTLWYSIIHISTL